MLIIYQTLHCITTQKASIWRPKCVPESKILLHLCVFVFHRKEMSLNGNLSHSNNLDVIDFAETNVIIILCLPNHSKQSLHPLDHSFFKPLRGYFKKESGNWMLQHKNWNATWIPTGILIGRAWTKVSPVVIKLLGLKQRGYTHFSQIPWIAFLPLQHNRVPLQIVDSHVMLPYSRSSTLAVIQQATSLDSVVVIVGNPTFSQESTVVFPSTSCHTNQGHRTSAAPSNSFQRGQGNSSPAISSNSCKTGQEGRSQATPPISSQTGQVDGIREASSSSRRQNTSYL